MKYSSVYARKDSPYWWVKYWDSTKQAYSYEATPHRRDDHGTKRKAREIANERAKAASDDKQTKGEERWEAWVEPWLQLAYGGPGREDTHTRMLSAWKQWSEYLEMEKVRVPRGLTYRHVLGFIKWRSSQVKPASGKIVKKNTALIDTKFMNAILKEAQRRGFVNGVVTLNLGIKKDPPKEKPEITLDELAKIRAELKVRPEWMRTCFEIAIHQGCRLSETQVSFDRVNFRDDTIQFIAKGRDGKAHVFTTRLHPGLKPILLELKARGQHVTCTLPSLAGKSWHFFFKEIGLPHLCFHCTRVTVITWLARSGVNEQQAMAYVGHASTEIHRVYQRLKPRDTGPATDALSALSALASSLPNQPSLLTDPVLRVERTPSADTKQRGLDLENVSTEELLSALAKRLPAEAKGAFREKTV